MRAYNIRSASNENWSIWQDCHLCGQTILKSAMDNHLWEFHSCAAADTSANRKKSDQLDGPDSRWYEEPKRNMTVKNYNSKEKAECPVCGMIFVKAMLEQHIQNTHGFSNEFVDQSNKKRQHRFPIFMMQTALKSRRGKYIGAGCCDICGSCSLTLTRYQVVNGKPLEVCEDCKSEVLGISCSEPLLRPHRGGWHQ
jgi:ssDNA-binding Zn-finger/Zn-ribbon topoisomerase 1